MDVAKTGKLIAEARRKKGLTQKELAEALHVSDRAVSKWERGLNLPDAAQFQPLCAALELTLTELLSGERAAAPEEPEAVLARNEQAVAQAVELALDKERRARAVRRATTAAALIAVVAMAALAFFAWGQYQKIRYQDYLDEDGRRPAAYIRSITDWGHHTVLLRPSPCGMYGPFEAEGGLFSAPLAVSRPADSSAYPSGIIETLEVWERCTAHLETAGAKSGMTAAVWRWPLEARGTDAGLDDAEAVPLEGSKGDTFTVETGWLYSVILSWGDGYYVEYAFQAVPPFWAESAGN